MADLTVKKFTEYIHIMLRSRQNIENGILIIIFKKTGKISFLLVNRFLFSSLQYNDSCNVFTVINRT